MNDINTNANFTAASQNLTRADGLGIGSLRPDPLRPDPLRPDPLRLDPLRLETARIDPQRGADARVPVQPATEQKPNPATPNPATPEPATPERRLLEALTMGENAVARRKDIGELHKRLVAMLSTLQQGLSETQANKAADDRAELVARMDQIDGAINSMEAALRIELEPKLELMVRSAFMQSVGRPPNRLFAALRQCVLISAALTVGVFNSTAISNFIASQVTTIFSAQTTAIAQPVSELPLNGGISNP